MFYEHSYEKKHWSHISRQVKEILQCTYSSYFYQVTSICTVLLQPRHSLKGFIILQIRKLKQEKVSNFYVTCPRSHNKQQRKDFHPGSLASELKSLSFHCYCLYQINTIFYRAIIFLTQPEYVLRHDTTILPEDYKKSKTKQTKTGSITYF